MKKAVSLVLFYFFLFAQVLGQIQTYTPLLDQESVKFKIKNFGLTVEGTFEGLMGKMNLDETNFENSFIDMTVNSITVNTGNTMRDSHLRKEDYFDVVAFPVIRFTSTKVASTKESGIWRVEGTLTIKNTSKEISFPFKANLENGRYLLTGQFSLDRQTYHVGGNSFSLSDNVTVYLNVQAIKNGSQ